MAKIYDDPNREEARRAIQKRADKLLEDGKADTPAAAFVMAYKTVAPGLRAQLRDGVASEDAEPEATDAETAMAQLKEKVDLLYDRHPNYDRSAAWSTAVRRYPDLVRRARGDRADLGRWYTT